METKVRTIRIDDFLWNELEKTSQKIGTTKSNLIKMAIFEKLAYIQRCEENEKKPKKDID